MNITFKGDEKLIRKLNKVEKKSRKKTLIRKAARRAAKPLQNRIKELAPKRTGVLKKSIKIRSIKGSKTNTGVMVASIFTNSNRTLGYYAHFVEFGTQRMTARQMFTNGVLQTKRQVYLIFNQELTQLLLAEFNVR